MWRKATPSVLLVCNNPGVPDVKNGENNSGIVSKTAKKKVSSMIKQYKANNTLTEADVEYMFNIWEKYFLQPKVHGFWFPPGN